MTGNAGGRLLERVASTILDLNSSTLSLQQALDAFARHCSDVSAIVPDRSFDGWAGDSLLSHGVAINPQAAAFCIRDYTRTVIFIRGVHAAITALLARCRQQPIRILYAGCGPFATLLLPLLTRFKAGQLDVTLLDIHQRSLDSVDKLLCDFALDDYRIQLVSADACHYRHPDALDLVIAETMQKSLEQEPQFAVTANLAPQLSRDGIFIPEQIDIELSLVAPAQEQATRRRYPLASVFTLLPAAAAGQMQAARINALSSKYELAHQRIRIPALANLGSLEALLFTRIKVFGEYALNDYDAEISLPSPCHELAPLVAGTDYEVCYELGSYPRFNWRRLSGLSQITTR